MKKGGKLSKAANELAQGAAKEGKQIDEGKLETIIKAHAAAAAVAAMGAGVLPGVGSLISTAISGAAVVSMYVRIGKYLQISIKKDLWKAIVTAIVTDLGASLVGSFILGFVPGLSVFTCGLMNYGIVYIAGIIYLTALTTIFHLGADPEKMTEEQLKEQFSSAAKSMNTKDLFSEAKSSFKQMKEDGSLEEQAKEADISEE